VTLSDGKKYNGPSCSFVTKLGLDRSLEVTQFNHRQLEMV
jgi:hypothetical protein